MNLVEHCEDLIKQASAIIMQGEVSGEEFAKAEGMIESVLKIDRDNAALVFLMGSLYMRAGRLPLAEHWLLRSLDMKADFPEAHNNLGFVCEQEGRREESMAHFNRANEIKPDCPEILNNLATAYVNNGTPLEAIEACDKVLAIDSNSLDAQWNKCLAHLELGNWEEGWDGYRVGLKLSAQTKSSTHRKVRHYTPELPYWEGTAGKSIVIYGEQGVGDEIMAASMLPDAFGDTPVTLESHPRLTKIMRHAFGNKIPIYGTRKQKSDDLPFMNWHKFDAQCPIFDLGRIYRRTPESFPKTTYLRPFDDRVEAWRERLKSNKPKIGFSWKGGSILTRNDLRSIPLEHWESFLKAFDVDWISLQYDPPESMGMNRQIVDKFNAATGLKVSHMEDEINDLDECYGGMIHALDLVISVNTSLVHACGAYGVRCWSMTPSKPAWRYGVKGDHMPWYGDHVTLYRQEGEDWGPVFQKIYSDLTSFLMEREAA